MDRIVKRAAHLRDLSLRAQLMLVFAVLSIATTATSTVTLTTLAGQRMHAGTLSFETECGKGTTFSVRLPVHAATDAGRAAA
jgi:light-regulated signal transduction histidine kinase (bacteriophytochrome)